jgi:hypothetical protein
MVMSATCPDLSHDRAAGGLAGAPGLSPQAALDPLVEDATGGSCRGGTIDPAIPSLAGPYHRAG